KYKTLDGRKSLGKVVKDGAVWLTTKKLYENQVPDWINNYIKSRSFSIEMKATQMLTDYIGNNLSRLSNEIEKILINFKEKTTIDAAMVQKFVGISKEYNAFELQRALGVKDILKANQIAAYFEANPKSNPIIPVIALLFSYFSKLLLIHHAKDKSDKNLASVLQVNPYFLKEYLLAARNYSLPKVVDNIHHLKIADLHIKGIDNVGATHGQILKELIYKLLH